VFFLGIVKGRCIGGGMDLPHLKMLDMLLLGWCSIHAHVQMKGETV
jgi:hypothetical protein